MILIISWIVWFGFTAWLWWRGMSGKEFFGGGYGTGEWLCNFASVVIFFVLFFVSSGVFK